jgi:hypothetical protein
MVSFPCVRLVHDSLVLHIDSAESTHWVPLFVRDDPQARHQRTGHEFHSNLWRTANCDANFASVSEPE